MKETGRDGWEAMKGEKESENKKDGRRGEGTGNEKGRETGRGRKEWGKVRSRKGRRERTGKGEDGKEIGKCEREMERDGRRSRQGRGREWRMHRRGQYQRQRRDVCT